MGEGQQDGATQEARSPEQEAQIPLRSSEDVPAQETKPPLAPVLADTDPPVVTSTNDPGSRMTSGGCVSGEGGGKGGSKPVTASWGPHLRG